MINKANTNQGTIIEHLLADSLSDHHNTFDVIKERVGIASNIEYLRPEVIGGIKRKTDVEFQFKDSTQVVTISVKSFTAGSNQLERRKLSAFAERNQLLKHEKDFLASIILRKARERCVLVLPEEREQAAKIFSRLSVGSSAILGSDHPQLLALYSMKEKKFKIYDIPTQVLPMVSSKTISFTSRGGNIAMGEYIVIQRKGGERGAKGDYRVDVDHASNHVQVKMKVKKFFNEIQPLCWYQL